MVRGVQLSTSPDVLQWRRTLDGHFQEQLQHPLLGSSRFEHLEAKVEVVGSPRVKFFVLFTCQDHCWTTERLARRGLQHTPCRVLCDQSETMAHLGCSFSHMVWHEVLFWTRSTVRPPVAGDDFMDWWQETCLSVQTSAWKGTSSASCEWHDAYGSIATRSSSTIPDSA